MWLSVVCVKGRGWVSSSGLAAASPYVVMLSAIGSGKRLPCEKQGSRVWVVVTGGRGGGG